MRLEVGEGGRRVGEPEAGNGPVGVLGDPPALALALDGELERAGGDRACGQRERLERPPAQARPGDEGARVGGGGDPGYVVGRLAPAGGAARAAAAPPAVPRESPRPPPPPP